MVDEGSQQNRDEVFKGFSSPSFTQTPNVFFDELMPDLGEAELKVLLYIIRRTWGFAGKQEGDTIALSQLCNGIVTADGQRLDRGTGLSKSGATKALLSLRTKGIITRIKNRDHVRGDTATTYRLRMLGEPLDASRELPSNLTEPLSTAEDTPVHAGGLLLSARGERPVHGQVLPVSTPVDTQKKDIQKKESGNKGFEISKDQRPRMNSFATRQALQPYIEDFAREFADQAKQSSTLSRAVDLCERSGLEIDEFIDVMMTARATTKENSASIKSMVPGDRWGKKAAIPYFFKVLEGMLGLQSKRSIAE